MKQTYERATIAIVALKNQDVITTSGVIGSGGEIYLPEDIF